MLSELHEGMRETIKSAAGKLSGFRRRQFQAEVAQQYCHGSARQAERVFGWGRDAVHTGLNELRTGIRCVDNFSGRGRCKTEEKQPTLVDQIHAIVAPESQADPKFQTPLAFTRITAKAVHEQLLARATDASQPVPKERTVYDILQRLGYRLRRVRKAQPQKNASSGESVGDSGVDLSPDHGFPAISGRLLPFDMPNFSGSESCSMIHTACHYTQQLVVPTLR